ncbi:jg15472 [Pararge aegeria aegeria]|uniref:Jg15472 protein n=1 Tax=Pararge aegeria aegeria TaxID=348720 RepID=A0A8S4S706_9NEOP|nr:jg15472 [Pararge aegeria aegeria]
MYVCSDSTEPVFEKQVLPRRGGCVYGNLFAPCLEVVKDDGTCGCFPFDPSLEEVATAVRKALVPSIHGRWERCFYGAVDCCSHFMNGNYTVQVNSQCPPTFDGWSCWQPAQNGTVARSVCPEFAYSNSGPTCHHFSHKQCHPQGAWELQTDYSTCSITPRLLRRYRYYIGVLTFSVVTSFPAICIFIFYKRLRVTRVALHRNLLIAIVLRNIIVVISRNVIYIDELTNAGETIMSQNSVACRVLAFAERLAGNAVFVCMMLEGIYLHRLIVAVFKQKLSMKILYCIGVC